MDSYPSHDALLEGLNAGRHDAFERIYGDYHPAIYNLCARILGDREEARDLTQDVFITAFSHPPETGRPTNLRPWLYKVATNACLNHLRRRDHLGDDETAVDGARAEVDEYERAETVALVEESLSALNERYRTALVLKDLHGLPATEIAEVMAVSRPAADVLVHRARAAFKTAFRRLGGEAGAAPSSLGLVLAPLSVPAALHTLPPLPVSLGAPLPDVTSSVGPAGAGLLTKIGTALSTKLGITAAVATIAVGGGAAVYTAERHADKRDGAPHAATVSSSGDVDDSGDWSAHDSRRRSRCGWDGHGWAGDGHHWADDGHVAGWDGHDGTQSSHDGSQSSGTTSGTTDHPSTDGGTSGTTHDGSSTWSPTHGTDGGSSTTHDTDSGW